MLKKVLIITILLFDIFCLGSCTLTTTYIQDTGFCGTDIERELKKQEIELDLSNVIINDEIKEYVSQNNDFLYLKTGKPYILTGKLKNKTIVIEKYKSEEINIDLYYVTIEISKNYAIYSDSDCKVNITSQYSKIKKNNIVSDNKPVIYVQGQLYLNESNSNIKDRLDISSEYDTLIYCEDELIIDGIELNLKSYGDAIKVKNDFIFKNGVLYIDCKDDAIKVSSDKKGKINILNGIMKIRSCDKGLICKNQIVIDDGYIDIESVGESITSKTIDINGGVLELDSRDDAINATDDKQDKKANQNNVYLKINGGRVTIKRADGDGIDSNGDLILERGELLIAASTNESERIVDYNGEIVLYKGFKMLGLGPSALLQDLGEGKDQDYIIFYSNMGKKPLNYYFYIYDSNNKKIFDFYSPNNFTAAIATSEMFVAGNKYKIVYYRDDDEKEKYEKEFILNKGKNVIYED